ncbi:MAG TPA: hypothetical protein VNB22_03485 [Pyrinomonadaceae bacterium]|nr:hypothetical protein [Pyrinomonadaceae bacterium]
MIRLLFLLLFLMSTAAFAQTEETPKPVKFDEFETATNGYVKMKTDAFYVELENNPSSQGYIINYGTDREIVVREKQLRDAIDFRKFDAARITLVRGGFWKNIKTELWIVPPGAENPRPSSTAEKFDEFLKMPDDELSSKLQSLYTSLAKDPKLKGYILIYGSPKLIASQKAQIQNIIGNLKLDSSRVIFKDAGFEKEMKTEFWLFPPDNRNELKTKILIVPPGAKPPTQ